MSTSSASPRPPASWSAPASTPATISPAKSAEWQVIGKIPFQPATSKIAKARTESDKSYYLYLAMQDLVQTAGRGMRSAQDRCETLIVDDNINWFLPMTRHMKPMWFEVRRMASIPAPPVKLAPGEGARTEPFMEESEEKADVDNYFLS